VVEFLHRHPDKLRKALDNEPDWMNNVARPVAYQAMLHPEQRKKLERLVDELSQKAPGYDREDNAKKFARYIEEAPQRDGNGARTIASFFDWAKSIGWTSTIAWTTPGHKAENRKLIQRQIADDPEMYSRNGLLVRLRVPEEDELNKNIRPEEGGQPGVMWKGDMPGTSRAQTADVMLCAERLKWVTYRDGKLCRAHEPREFIGDYIPQLGGKALSASAG
jgi:hypothetical protein